MLSEPGKTDYDLEFEFLGFPVRVSIGFWIMGLVLGYDSASGSNDRVMTLLLWIAVLFVSILVHELGHALAFRRFGVHSGIVLYHFGGLAIPRNSFRGFSGGSLKPVEKIIVSFAGPAAQLALAGLVLLLLRSQNYAVPSYLRWLPYCEGGNPITSTQLFLLTHYALSVNLFWSLLNLLPIWPLDGGQITREVVYLMGGTIYHSSAISIAACIVAAILAFQSGFGSIFTLFFLGSFAYTNYQLMNNQFGGRWVNDD